MRHLKRFRNWLGYVYSASWAFRRQFGAGDSRPSNARAAEESHAAADDEVLATDAEPGFEAQSSSQQSELIGSPSASELAKAELAKAELAKAELAKAELAKAELAKAELAKAELAKAELRRKLKAQRRLN